MNFYLKFFFKYVFILSIINSCGPSKYIAPVEDRSKIGKYNTSIYKKELVIVKGDSLYSISEKEGISVRSIIDANKLEAPFILYPGDQLIIPFTKKHIVKKGETLWHLSKCYGVDIVALREINKLQTNDTIKKGMKLKIPAKVKGALSECFEEVANRNISEKVKVKNNKDLNEKVVNKYIWPVEGKILSNFGISSSGLKNDGVNILSEQGNPVLAANSGKVVYSGNEIQAFGNLVLIKHKNNKTTAYAHLENVIVSRGQHVKRGEVIANVGSTGKVSIPQLHFELRDSSGPLNPLKYLPENKWN